MITELLILLLGAFQAAPPQVDPAAEAAYVAQIRTDLRACGISAEPRRLEFDDDYQSYAIGLDSPDLTATNVQCLANTPGLDGPVIEFADPHFEDVYREAQIARPDLKAAYEDSMRRWREDLDARGLLAGAPTPVFGQPPSIYVRALESHCGLLPGSIGVDDDTGAVNLLSGKPSFDQFSCVFGLIMLTVADMTNPIQVMGADHTER